METNISYFNRHRGIKVNKERLLLVKKTALSIGVISPVILVLENIRIFYEFGIS